MTQESIIEKIKALTLKPCSPSQEYGFEECRKMVLSILEADKPVDAGITQQDISKIMVANKYRSPVGKHDTAVWFVDIPKASQLIIELLRKS